MDKSIVPRGIRNNNPLNIRKGNNWQGERHPQTDKAFEEFESMQYGIRAGFKLIKKYMSGYNGLTKKFNTIREQNHTGHATAAIISPDKSMCIAGI